MFILLEFYIIELTKRNENKTPNSICSKLSVINLLSHDINIKTGDNIKPFSRSNYIEIYGNQPQCEILKYSGYTTIVT